MFACIISFLAQIRINLPGLVPITLQTLGIYLVSCTLKPKLALITVIVYLSMGIIGLPVYTGFQAGISTIVGPTGGYLGGFIVMVLIISLINKNDHARTKILAMIIGTIACYIIGTVWFIYLTNNSYITALTLCVLPFIPGDIIKILIACSLSTKLKKRI